jgi:hypothetical protein
VNVSEVQGIAQKIRAEIGKAVIGQTDAVARRALLRRCWRAAFQPALVSIMAAFNLRQT